MAKKRKLRIILNGKGLSPDTTPANALAEIVVALEKSIFEAAAAKGISFDDTAFLSLLACEKGSNKIVLSVAKHALPLFALISQALASGDYSTIPRTAQQQLHEISKSVSARNWALKMPAKKSLNIARCEISQQKPVPLPCSPELIGTTTLYGKCVRVGGVEPTAEISLLAGQTIYPQVTPQIAKQLAKRLYEEVGITGKAVWDTENWKIKRFEVTEIIDYQKTDLVSAFENLRIASKGKWDGIDAIEYVKNIRHGSGV